MNEHSRTEYSMINIMAGVGGYIINAILGFICRMVFAKYLSADYLGVNGLFTNILSMLSLAELGIGGAIVYALYKPLAEHNEKKIASLVKVYGTAYKFVGIVVGIIGICLMPFLNVIITEQPSISESIYVLYLLNLFNTVITYFFSYRSSLLIAAQQNYIVVGVNYTITILQSILHTLVLVCTHNYMAYLLIQTVGIVIYNLLISHIAVRRFPYITGKSIEPLSQKEKGELFKNVKDLTFYKISGLLVNSTDNILITFFQGLATTGIASNYTLLVNMLNSLLGQIFNSLTASIGNHNAIENIEKKHEMFRFLNMVNAWIYGWGALGIYFCSSDLVRVCFGENYVLHESIPMILAINFYISGVTNIVGTYKHTLGLFRQGRFIQIGTGVVNIILSIILGKYWGLFGILCATGIARACTHLWYTPYVVYKYGFNMKTVEYWKSYFKYTLIVLLSAIICKWITSLIPESFFFQVVLKMVLCSIIANGVFVMTLFRTSEFKRLLQYKDYILRKNQ